MNIALRRKVMPFCLLAAVASLTLSCSRRAPGPDECVRFAEMYFEAELAVVAMDPNAKAVFDRLVETCLTAPFDRRVFVCLDESRAPIHCLQSVHPELFTNREAIPQVTRRLRPRSY